MKQDKVLSLLGLAMRAGKVASGGFAVEQSIKKGAAGLVIVSDDTSAASKKHFRDMCTYRGIELCEYADKDSLGPAIGKEFRSVVSVEDPGFAESILKLLKEDLGERQGGSAIDGKDQ